MGRYKDVRKFIKIDWENPGFIRDKNRKSGEIIYKRTLNYNPKIVGSLSSKKTELQIIAKMVVWYNYSIHRAIAIMIPTAVNKNSYKWSKHASDVDLRVIKRRKYMHQVAPFIQIERIKMQEYMVNKLAKQGINVKDIIDEISLIAFDRKGYILDDKTGEANMKINTTEKLRALDMLGRHMGIYDKDNRQKAANSNILQIAFIGEGDVVALGAKTSLGNRKKQIEKGETLPDMNDEQQHKFIEKLNAEIDANGGKSKTMKARENKDV